jgi:hypothetical protein
MIKLLFMILILSSCSTNLPVVEHTSTNDYKIVGKLDKQQYDEIIEIVRCNPGMRINFYVSSIGGTSNDLFLAMDSMNEHGNVHWYSVGYCESACAVMALSTKHAHGHFRLHSFYKKHGNHIEASPYFNGLVLQKLEVYGYDIHNIQHMFSDVYKMYPFVAEESVIIEE